MDRRRRREVSEVVEVVGVGLVVLERLEALGQEVEGFLRFAVLDVFEELLAVTHVQEGALGLRAETAGTYESFEDAVLAIWTSALGHDQPASRDSPRSPRSTSRTTSACAALDVASTSSLSASAVRGYDRVESHCSTSKAISYLSVGRAVCRELRDGRGRVW